MPSRAPRRSTTTNRFSVGAAASARVARPSVALVARPSRAVRRVRFTWSTPLKLGAGEQQSHGIVARSGAPDRRACLGAKQGTERGVGDLDDIAVADAGGETAGP